ncbi:MAG TPA: PspA/IM30 family protein [Actinomycetes bacterium]|nr:PspA/IM30 family protein [Actinomycetes bacterium]
MGLMQRFSTLFKAKASKTLDKYEDPRETLDYSYERTLEMLQKMRRAVADVATSRKRIELQAQQLQRSAAKLEGQAKQAVSQDREDLAREALTRRQAIATQLTDLQAQHDQLKAEEARMVEASRRLQAKVDSFRIRKETMKANYTAAEAQTKVNEAISGIGEEMGDVGLAMQRAEDKVAQMQARSGALDERMASGALDDASMSSDRLQAELDRGFAEPAVEAELARLKGELPGASTTAKQLDAPDEDAAGAPADAPAKAPAKAPAETPAEEERR